MFFGFSRGSFPEQCVILDAVERFKKERVVIHYQLISSLELIYQLCVYFAEICIDIRYVSHEQFLSLIL